MVLWLWLCLCLCLGGEFCVENFGGLNRAEKHKRREGGKAVKAESRKEDSRLLIGQWQHQCGANVDLGSGDSTGLGGRELFGLRVGVGMDVMTSSTFAGKKTHRNNGLIP